MRRRDRREARGYALWTVERWAACVVTRAVTLPAVQYMRTIVAFTCLATTAAALRLTSALRVPLNFAQRTRKLCAQSGWITSVDESGRVYYYNEETGQSEWELPSQESSGQVLLRLTPACGVLSEYTLSNGEQQVLSRFDMATQKTTVSRMQCLVHVDADGTASVVSIGKRPTGLRRHSRAPWYGLSRDATHVLKDGEEIALDMDSGESVGYQGTPYSAVFTCQIESAGMGDLQQSVLPTGWSTGVDEASGALYYYNEQTSQSQWDPP